MKVKLRGSILGPGTFVQTSPCGAGQWHPDGYVGYIFKIVDPDTVRMGSGFMNGRLKKGDFVLCVAHSGDNFQDYIPLEEHSIGLKRILAFRGLIQYRFGSYGIGNSIRYRIPVYDAVKIASGEMVDVGELVEFPRR